MSTSTLRMAALALLVPVLALAAIVLARPAPAEAHPLGNFTVNRYSRLELYSDAIRVRYILDMAEIPTFQETPAIDANDDGELSPPENEAYLRTKSAEIVRNLRLAANGSNLNLTMLSGDVTYPEGQAGLKTLRLTFLLNAPVSANDIALEYGDDNYADRVGWKEVVVRATDGVTVSATDAATEDASAELTTYPADLLSSPLDVTSARVSYSAAGGAVAPAVDAVQVAA
ncbi:MAG TPA: hypothetical protein VGR43_05835, partial [Dehalococcoidia bacterium]|nr:hypothetical protein [Dehalococcoidia bacterium]